MKPMKSSVKVVLSGVSGFVYPIILLFLTGLFEFLVQSDSFSWYFEILLGTAVPILFLILENRFISRQLALACNTAYFIAAAVVCVFVLLNLTSFYVENYYHALNPWDNVWFSGLQWVLYLITLYILEGLHLIVRLVIAFARRMAKEHEALRGEKEEQE
ncbi:MAG: hypothetical protein ACI4J4_04505, partial [Ruminiclostridium sp.]